MIQKPDNAQMRGRNVLGGDLKTCSKEPLTGFFPQRLLRHRAG